MKPTRAKPARNERCPCGSGRKFKQCCLNKAVPPTADQRFAAALACERRGEHAAAAAIYAEILAHTPSHVPSLQALGLVYFGRGERAAALTLLRHACELAPEDAELQNNLGAVLTDARQVEAAIVHLHKAITLRPHYAEAHNNMGSALRAYGKPAEAEHCYREALRLHPDFPPALNNMGSLLRAAGRLSDALVWYRRALELAPTSYEGWTNLGNILLETDRLAESLPYFEEALRLAPHSALANYNFANALKESGARDRAGQLLARAAELDPTLAEAHNNLGNIRREQGCLPQALACFSRALAVRPAYQAAHSNLLFTTAYMDDLSPADIFALHCGWADLQAAHVPPSAPHDNLRDPHKRLKIGYVSPDFRTHACALFLAPLLYSHNRSVVEVYAYAEVAKPDAVTAQLQGQVAVWRSTVGLSDEELASLIRHDGIDVLVDLAGHTANNRLSALARKPAPVQATYLGYPATTGLPAVDWRITDAVTEPPGLTERYYTEQLYRLPHSLWCYLAPSDMGAIPPLPALSRGYVTFGSLNNYAKVGSRVVALWAAVLTAVPSARLRILTVPEGETQDRLLAQFAALGIAGERLDLLGRVPRDRYIRSGEEIDIALDPFPCNGGTTTCDALWMGLPVVALQGNTFLSRASLSVLSAAGYPQFAAANEAQYIAHCVGLAGDLNHLAEIRQGLRAQMAASSLMDVVGFTADMEAAYRAMWVAWCERPTAP